MSAIWFLDDCHLTRKLLQRQCFRLGISMVGFERATDLLLQLISLNSVAASARVALPKVIFADLHLGEASGLQAITQIRAAGFTNTLVACSATFEGTSQQNALAAGADCTVLKPFDDATLQAVFVAAQHKCCRAA